eukprot:1466715-Alexandrium_andersonii.AAC.1
MQRTTLGKRGLVGAVVGGASCAPLGADDDPISAGPLGLERLDLGLGNGNPCVRVIYQARVKQ